MASASWRRTPVNLTLVMAAMAFLFFAVAAAAKDEPKVSVSKFDHLPAGLAYFEDSDSVVFHDMSESSIYRSDDAGASWSQVKDVPRGEAMLLIMHRFDPKTAFVLTEGTYIYKTTDRGASWTKLYAGTAPSAFQSDLLLFHADDPNRIILNGMRCEGIFCNEEAVYTTDGFKSVDLLRGLTAGCWWAKSSPEFTTGDPEKDKSRTLCIIMEPFSSFKEDQRLHISDSFFADNAGVIDEFEPNLDTDRAVDGVINIAVVKKYLLVATASLFSDEMALYVSDDSVHWHRAMFPTDDSHDHSHQINQNAYTVLESTNYSIQVDVMTSHPSKPIGVLFTSNSNGTYFTENVPYTNRNQRGHVDFEKLTGIQGVYLVNLVDNPDEVETGKEEKMVVSRITFDDGRTFETLAATDNDTLHLHSSTELDNVGRVFSSMAPGLVMGNGNTGKQLGDFKDSDLYVSDNAGLTWKKALDGPHKYEFGDSGSVLVAVKSADDHVDKFSYSTNHGDDWHDVSFPNDIKIKPLVLTTTQDSTSLKFLLLGEAEGTYHIIALDFSTLHERTCKDNNDDMEDWHARVDDDGKPTCVMGHKQTYRRRKKSADCFVKSDFKDPVPIIEDCECTDEDFECDYNFQRDADDKKKCNQVGSVIKPDGVCKNGKEGTFKGTSGWRLIPGNTCKRGKGEQLDDEVERNCTDIITSPGSGNSSNGEVSSSKPFEFDTKLQDFEKIYLEKGGAKSGDDVTVIARPAENVGGGRFKVGKDIWMTTDHGMTWEKILEGKGVRGIHTHPHYKDVVFFTTEDETVYYTIDRGHSFHSFKAPTVPKDSTLPVSFHPDRKDWLLWVGEQCEDVGKGKSCSLSASLSKDRGDDWTTIARYVKKCEFTGHSAIKFRSQDQIVCLAHEEESSDSPLTIVTSDDFFATKTEFKGEAMDFATMSEFIVLAGTNSETAELRAYASLDGKHFEPAHFPHNFQQNHVAEYTVLDSSTHAINLFVLSEPGADHQYGSIVKSNSNGTSYVMSAPKVNCDEEMYVDFEKVPGLEGVTLINEVTNAGNKKAKTKELQTKISHNDGAEWGYLAPPAKDVDGKAYDCRSSTGDASCALHVHHYTERDDKRRTFAASTAVGLLFGVGNVGSRLGDIAEADTFLSTDGGISWANVKKGHWTWQYGDQGSIIVLVQRATAKNKVKTRTVSYSLDEGRTWHDYDFIDRDVTVLDITTVRAGTSRNFLLWCTSDDGKALTVSLDFGGFADRPCRLNKEDPEADDSDYYLWSPKHPLQENGCLFGHVAKYLRKKPEAKCYNEQNLQRLYEYENCPCTRQDYEWYAPSLFPLSRSLPLPSPPSRVDHLSTR